MSKYHSTFGIAVESRFSGSALPGFLSAGKKLSRFSSKAIISSYINGTSFKQFIKVIQAIIIIFYLIPGIIYFDNKA